MAMKDIKSIEEQKNVFPAHRCTCFAFGFDFQNQSFKKPLATAFNDIVMIFLQRYMLTACIKKILFYFLYVGRGGACVACVAASKVFEHRCSRYRGQSEKRKK